MNTQYIFVHGLAGWGEYDPQYRLFPYWGMACGDLMRALYSIDKNVPEDVRILGFDDAPESRISRPALSTVHIHTQVMAFSAVQLLINRMKEPSLDYRTVHTQTDLILRESTLF